MADQITLPLAVVRQALEALGKTMNAWGGTCEWHRDVKQAITALSAALAQAEPVQPVASKYRVMVCGVDCHPGDQHCNGYCTGKTDDPPEATAEPAAWEHLRKYGYAPGGYVSRCNHCGLQVVMDKRAVTCRFCAEALHTKQQAEPVQEQTRSQKLAAAGYVRRPSLWALQAREVLELIATPQRPDGTWNRDREACRQLAAEMLAAREAK